MPGADGDTALTRINAALAIRKQHEAGRLAVGEQGGAGSGGREATAGSVSTTSARVRRAIAAPTGAFGPVASQEAVVVSGVTPCGKSEHGAMRHHDA